MPGAQKGAHYSAPLSFGTPRAGRSARAWAAVLAGCWLCAGPGAGAAPNRAETDARKTEAQLQAVKSEIERISREVSGEQVERDRLSRELTSAELSVGQGARVAGSTCAASAPRARRAAPRSPPRRRRARGELSDNRAALAGQMRAAYLIGRAGAAEAAAQPEGPGARRAHVRLLQLLRPRARRPDQAHRGRRAAPRRARPAARRRGRAASRSWKSSSARSSLSLEQAREQRAQRARQSRGTSRTPARRTSSGCSSQQAGLEKLLRELRARARAVSRSRATMRSRTCAASSPGR